MRKRRGKERVSGQKRGKLTFVPSFPHSSLSFVDAVLQITAPNGEQHNNEEHSEKGKRKRETKIHITNDL